jgi:large subunit ribosomal protein L2
MGKRIIQRARGKGSLTYRSPGHRFAGKIGYPWEDATVIDIIHDAGRDSPLAKVVDSQKRETLIVAAEGLTVGNKISVETKDVKVGNIMRLADVPKGALVFAIEVIPQSGPKLCCTAGTHAIVVSHEKDRVIVQMPSKKFKNFKPKCLATLGISAGGGRNDKAFLSAGRKSHAMRARNKLYPRTSAVAMNAVDHPFGGQTKPGRPKSISRWAPPGKKVGSVAARRTGRKKK